MNTVHILGRIARMEIKSVEKEGKTIKIAEFSVACERNYKTDVVDFIPCVAYDNKAAFMERYMQKGQRIYVVGSIRIDGWEKDGEKHYKTYVTISEIQNADKIGNTTTATAETEPFNIEG